MYKRNIDHNAWSNFCLLKKKGFRKLQKSSTSSSCNIGKILLIFTSVSHLVGVQDRRYCKQTSRYHKNTILQFPHQHVETRVSNRQSIFFSKCKLNFHTCLDPWPSLETFPLIPFAFISFILSAHHLCSFSRPLSVVFIFLWLFLLHVYFCISFLRALPSHVGFTDCVSYFKLSIGLL